MEKMYNMSKEERDELGKKGRQHVVTNYSHDTLMEKWDNLFTRMHDENGSWENRKNYKAWRFKEVI